METQREKIAMALKRTDEVIESAKKYMLENGIAYDLEEWITPKRYSVRFGVSEQVVHNWIKRGVIPPENIKEIEELNGLRLVKAVAYKQALLV